ncbi:MAG TPA: NADP-dependent oxidoreductase [Mycobacteriales bacterium]|nr:NADP-dependent oxidoreductase [Mycobacteriales bacterium]
MTTSREWHLVRRPHGWPTTDDVELVTAEVGDPGRGELLVRNLVMSVDPYMRGRMNDARSYAPPYTLNQPMYGGAVGRVEKSGVDGIAPGTVVRHGLGWREWALVPHRQAEVVDPSGDGVPPSTYLGVLGMPGLTAWVGLYDIAEVRPGETLFVSAAAGAVGSIVGQLAKISGLRVVGSAGTPEKVAWLHEIGFDAAFDYHDGDVTELLAKAAPEGIDCYFDNVGGDHLRAALASINPFGRIAACGMISAYNESVPGPDNLFFVVGKKLTMRGFIVSDHADREPAFRRHVAPLIASGRLQVGETHRDGIESAFEALLDVLRGGKHTGKMVVDITTD